jgi:hypothetical protein
MLIYTENIINSIEILLAYANDIKYKGYRYRRNTFTETVVSAALAFLFIAASFAFNPITLEVYAEEEKNNKSTVVIKEQASYIDRLSR